MRKVDYSAEKAGRLSQFHQEAVRLQNSVALSGTSEKELFLRRYLISLKGSISLKNTGFLQLKGKQVHERAWLRL